MPLSWNEIQDRAYKFIKEWENETSESAEAKSFWDSFFNIFGVPRRKVASFETPVKKLGGKSGNIDLLWKGKLLVEHKSKGKNLDAAYTQAKDYFVGLKDYELPRYIIVSDFEHFRLYDLDEDKQNTFNLPDLVKNISLFGFIAGYPSKKPDPQDPVNIDAAILLGQLHDELKKNGYQGHYLEVYLVRILYCLFADDTGIFEPKQFQDYIEIRTLEDGSDLAHHLSTLFYNLNQDKKLRMKNLDQQIKSFSYIDGKLFEENLPPAAFDSQMRETLLKCCSLDWSRISPAIFGSLFQTVREEDDPNLRRQLGAHYTTEENIMKVIEPLFLNDLRNQLDEARGDKAELLKIQNKLLNMKFFDPACGCGNFLVIAYKAVRELEIELLAELYAIEQKIEVPKLSTTDFVDVHQFYGIEIDEFSVQVARVALWMVDHQMNLEVSKRFGPYFNRIPLEKAPKIKCDNALKVDWNEFLAPNKCTYILSNPPFVGKQYRTKSQKEDMNQLFANIKGANRLDYVSAWYLKAAKLIDSIPSIKIAYVSTNSITQGEQASVLWNELINNHEIRINFAYRTFKWSSEVNKGKAAVHCVIIGFSKMSDSKITLYDEHNACHKVKNINPYLVDAPNIVLCNRSESICDVPKIVFGNMPNDGGNLLLNNEEKEAMVKAEPKTKKWIKPFIGASEFLNNKIKWCLWLEEITPHELKSLKHIHRKVKNVKVHRASSKREDTRKLAKYPHLFGFISKQSKSKFVLIPRVTSERRLYIPLGYFTKGEIVGDTNLCVPNATLYHFGILHSLMHMSWVRVVCGRLKSDYRYSNTLVYNNFPWPTPTQKQINQIEKAANEVLIVREQFHDSCLADLYDPDTMPVKLVKAHETLDKAVDDAYGVKYDNEADRVAFLFKLYEEITEQKETASAEEHDRVIKKAQKEKERKSKAPRRKKATK